MFNDPVNEYYDSLIPVYEAYIAASKTSQGGQLNIKGPALNAVHTLFHYRESIQHLFPKETFTRKEVSKLSCDYDLIADISNAHKHKELKRKDRLIENHLSIFEAMVCSPWFQRPNENTLYPYATDNVIQFHAHFQWCILVKMLNGEEKDVLEIATNVINFWTSILFNKHLIDQPNYYSYIGNNAPTLSTLNNEGITYAHRGVQGKPSYIAVRLKYFDIKSFKWIISSNLKTSEWDLSILF